MKALIVFMVFTFSIGFVQINHAQVIEEPKPAPCDICGTPCTKNPGAAYGYGWTCTHKPTCKYYTGASNQPEQQQTPETNFMQSMPTELQQLNSLIDQFNAPKTDTTGQAAKEAAKLREQQMKALEDQQRLERNEQLKSEMKGFDNPPPPTQEILAQSMIFQSCVGDNIEIKRNGVWIKADCANKAEMITVGESVRTGPNSTIQLTMLNLENKIQINPNSEFVYVVKNNEFSLELLYGKVRSTLKKLNKKFQVRTGSGTCSVRGTDFETIVYEDGSTEFVLYEGKIEITPTGSETVIVLVAGQKIRIYLDGKIIGPVLLDAELTAPK